MVLQNLVEEGAEGEELLLAADLFRKAELFLQLFELFRSGVFRVIEEAVQKVPVEVELHIVPGFLR